MCPNFELQRATLSTPTQLCVCRTVGARPHPEKRLKVVQVPDVDLSYFDGSGQLLNESAQVIFAGKKVPSFSWCLVLQPVVVRLWSFECWLTLQSVHSAPARTALQSCVATTRRVAPATWSVHQVLVLQDECARAGCIIRRARGVLAYLQVRLLLASPCVQAPSCMFLVLTADCRSLWSCHWHWNLAV